MIYTQNGRCSCLASRSLPTVCENWKPIPDQSIVSYSRQELPRSSLTEGDRIPYVHLFVPWRQTVGDGHQLAEHRGLTEADVRVWSRIPAGQDHQGQEARCH